MKTTLYNFKDVTGATHKEVGVDEAIQDAREKGLDAICVISSGNYVEALREKADDLMVFNLVNRKPRDTFEVEIPETTILTTAEERRDLVRSKGFTGSIDDYTDFLPKVYSEHAENILKENPDYVVCPIGSGKLWLSIVNKVEELGLGTKVIGVTAKGKNGFYWEGNWDLESIADKLTAPHTSLGKEVLSKKNHTVFEASERELRKAYRRARRERVDCEPSGAVGFMLYDRKFRREIGIGQDNSVVIISTGSGLSDTVDKIHKKSRISSLPLIALSVVAGGLLAYGVLYNALYPYADINGDGTVAPEEIIETKARNGEFFLGNFREDTEKLEKAKAFPRLTLKDLLASRKIKKDSIANLKGKYENHLGQVSTIIGRDVESLDELSQSELSYLHAYEEFTQGNSELFRAYTLPHDRLGREKERNPRY